MKKNLLLLVLVLQPMLFLGQNSDESTKNSVVYFTRASGLGALINFTYFDGEKVIGRFNGPKYLRYECSPGKHLFWARSENKSYVEANLEAGKIYVIDVLPRMGGLKAAVLLVPVDKYNYKLKRIQKLLSKRDSETFEESELNALQPEMTELIQRGMERYEKLKEKGKEIPILRSDMTVEEEDLVFVKKSKKA